MGYNADLSLVVGCEINLRWVLDKLVQKATNDPDLVQILKKYVYPDDNGDKDDNDDNGDNGDKDDKDDSCTDLDDIDFMSLIGDVVELLQKDPKHSSPKELSYVNVTFGARDPYDVLDGPTELHLRVNQGDLEFDQIRAIFNDENNNYKKVWDILVDYFGVCEWEEISIYPIANISL